MNSAIKLCVEFTCTWLQPIVDINYTNELFVFAYVEFTCG